MEEYFLRAGWLRGRSADELLDSTFVIRPGVALEEVSLADTSAGIGFTREVTRVSRTDGPRFSHKIDAGVRAVLAGLHPQGLSLRDVVGLFAASRSMTSENQLQGLEATAVAAIVDLIRHGIVVPAEIAEVISPTTQRKE